MLRKKTTLPLALLVILGMIVYVMGCGDFEDPVAGTPTGPQLSTLPPLDGVDLLPRSEGSGDYELMPGNDQIPNFVESLVGRFGGEVSLQDVTIDIPNNAIPTGVVIEVSILIPDPSLYLFDLGPDGYVFQKDVKIRVYLDNAELTGIDPDNLGFVYYDEDAGTWVSEGGSYNEKDNYVEAKIGHFSYWALASD